MTYWGVEHPLLFWRSDNSRLFQGVAVMYPWTYMVLFGDQVPGTANALWCATYAGNGRKCWISVYELQHWTPGSGGEAAGAPVNMAGRKAEQDWVGFGRSAACVGAGPLAWAPWQAAAPRSCLVIKPAWQMGQGVRLTMKYDGLTTEAAGVTCFQTLHLEVIILLDASYNLWWCWLW